VVNKGLRICDCFVESGSEAILLCYRRTRRDGNDGICLLYRVSIRSILERSRSGLVRPTIHDAKFFV
jgi:hypothetical protein